MVIKTFRIPYKYGETVKIKPLFDIHWGNRYCDRKALVKYLEESDENTYFFGGGDCMDSIVIPDKRYAKHVDNTMSDAIIDEQVNGLVSVLEPYKSKILGMGRGNHEDTVIRHCGTDPAERVCKDLGVEYLGFSGYLRLMLSEGSGRTRTVKVKWAHGWGGGSRTVGADLTKFSRDIMYWECDVMLVGHVHKRQSDRIDRLGLVGGKLAAKPVLLGICGTYLKTFTDTTDSTYSEIKGYPPTSIGGITLNIKPTANWVQMWIDNR